MVDASGLIEALKRDNLDQRAVADHLMLLAKGLKNSTASAVNAEPSASTTPALSAPTSTVEAHPPEREVDNDVTPAPARDTADTATVVQPGGGGIADDETEAGKHGKDLDEGPAQLQEHAAATSVSKSDTRPKDDLLLELIRSFRGGMLRVDSNIRATMFRALRYLVRTSEDVEVIRKQRFGLFIALALAREQYELWERMQALKLVKQIIAVDSSKLPREVLRTVVAVSGHKEDNFRRVCLETLTELAVADPRVVAHANGFRVLFAATIDPANQDLAELLMATLMSILEDPTTRRYVRPHLELHQLLTGFTDLDAPPGPERAHRWKATSRALVVAMRSWAGVHLLASDSRGLVTLLRLLRDPSSSFSEDAGLQDSILETIMDIFDPLVGVGRPASSAELGNKPRGTSFADKLFIPFSGSAATLSQKGAGSGLRTRKGSEPHNLLLSYATLLCAAFVHCGLIPSLTELSISAGSEDLRAKAATLLVDVLRLCAMLLSQNQCTRLLSMPGLVQIAAESQTGSMAVAQAGARSCHLTRSRASRASDLIRLLHGALGAGAGGPVTAYLGQQNQAEQPMVTIGGLMQKVYEAESNIDSFDVQRSWGWEPTGTLEQMRKELRVSIESTVEKSVMDTQIHKSKVLSTKDWTKWDWDVVDDIVQDTLSHPPRLVDILRTKWIKRVSGFYRFVGAGNSGTSTDRGGGGGLHNMRWDPDHIRHIACAGRLYSLLLQQPEGVHFLQTDARGAILQEIVKELQALVTRRCSSGSGAGRLTGASKVFDMESCQRRLSGGYITLLFSVTAGTDAGRELLANTGLWNHLASMGNQPELDYMSRLVMTKIDLNSDKFIPRDVLKSWMTTSSSHLQLFATNLMRTALRSASAADRRLRDPALAARTGGTSNSDEPRPEEWCIETLVAQLNGDEAEVARAALSVLEEATQDERCLRYLVLAKPDLTSKPGASNLLMRFLSIPEGIQYLEELECVEGMVRDWKESGRTTSYAASVDATWKTHVNEVEHVEDTLDMEPVPERGSAPNESGVAIPITTSNIPFCLYQEGAIEGSLDGREMQMLLGLPWNIEVMLSRDSVPTSGLQLRVDTVADALSKEDAPNAGSAATGTPGATKMVVRGILVDSAGKPTCHPLEAHLTLHARLCVGACAVDRRGNIQWNPTSPMDKQTAPFGRNRTGRNPRSQWSPQHGRVDHGIYGSSYRGVQSMQDFGPGREMPEDPSDLEHQLFWSTCRPLQRLLPPAIAVNPGSNLGKDGGRPINETRTVSPVSNMPHDETRGPDERQALSSSKDSGGCRKGTGGTSESHDEAGGNAKDNARSAAWGHERVVRVPKETARWVFTNQPQPEDAITMKVVENTTSVTYLKAVEMTISLKDVGPAAILLPPHLYGELAKTERGCQLLRQHGDLKNLLFIARNTHASADDRKGALWAVAHVCSWPLGLTLLEELQDDIIGILLSMVTAESHLSVWGTSFCVVSLAARTARGRAAIRAAGWESARDPSTSIFLPQDPTVLFQPVPWKFEGSPTQGLDEQPSDAIVERLRQNLASTRDADILHQVAKLSSHISRKEAMRKLSRMRKDKAHKGSFTNSLPMFLLVHQLLADYSFSLPMRRYIFELFEQVTPGTSDWEPYVA